MKEGQPFNPFRLFVGSFLPNCLMKDPDLDSTEKLVWARLAQYAGKGGRAFPSQETLAEEVGVTPQGVRAALRRLKKHRLIRIEAPKGAAKLSHRPNEYVFLWHSMFEESESDSPTLRRVLEHSPESYSSNGPESYSSNGPIEEDQIEEDRSLRERGTRGAKWTTLDFRRHFCYQWRRRYDSKYPILWGKDTAHAKYVVDYFDGEASSLKRLLAAYFGNDFYKGHTISELRIHLSKLLATMADKEEEQTVQPGRVALRVLEALDSKVIPKGRASELELAIQDSRRWYQRVVATLSEVIQNRKEKHRKQKARTGRQTSSDLDPREGTLNVLTLLPRPFTEVYANWIENQVSKWEGWEGSFKEFRVGKRHWRRFLLGFWKSQDWRPNEEEWKIYNAT